MSDSLSKQKKLVPISEAAKVLGISIDTVRRWDKSGVLHSERLDGKNRYFSLDELEQHKFHQPLPISEVAKNLSISATTLRRLEARGLIKPKRNNAGERVYDKDLLKNFLNSDYFLRKKQIKEKILEPFQEDLPTNPDVKIRSRMREFWAISTLGFVMLVTFSVRNINISAAESHNLQSSPEVLAETQGATPIIEATATAEMKPEITLTVKIDDGSSFVNIRQKPAISSEKIGKANDGDTFAFTSEESGWYEIRLADGSTAFISKKYTVTNERNN